MKIVPIVLGSLMIVLLCRLVFQVINSHRNMSDSDILIPPVQSRRQGQDGTFTISKTQGVHNASASKTTQADRRNNTDVMIQIHEIFFKVYILRSCVGSGFYGNICKDDMQLSL